MNAVEVLRTRGLAQRLSEAEATIEALLSGQIDAVVDSKSQTPVLLSKAQDALRESEARYRRIIETTNEGVWLIDAENKTTFMNRRMAEMLGCEADMGLGRSPFEFLDEEGRAILTSYLQSPDADQVELRYVRPDGTGVWTLLEATPVLDSAGRYDGSLAMVMDITQRKQAEEALRASEARFRRLWDSGVILITICDRKGKILEVNDAGLGLLGYSRAEFLSGGFGWGDITPLEWHDADEAAHTQLMTSGVAAPLEKEIIRKDGTRVSILAASAVLNGTDGITIAIDLTERKRAEKDLRERKRLGALTTEALRETEEGYRRIVETANEGISTIDAESKITFVNRRFAEMFGYPAHEMVGKSWLQFLPESSEARAAHQRRVERSRQGILEDTELGLVRKDGSELWALLKTSPIRDADGTHLGTLAMVTDRTRYKQAEEALRKSEEQYRQIVEATTDGILKIDGIARIVFVNRRFAEMLGYELHEMIGMSVFGFMSDAAKVTAADSLQRRRRGEKAPFDATFRHKDGTEISVNIAGSPLVDEEGRHIGNLAVVRDVTERNKMHSQLMVSDRMASVGTLAAGVAHEINNPLAAVISNLDYIADSLSGMVGGQAALSPGGSDAWVAEEIKAPLEDARDAAQRVRFIVRDLKMFSRSPTDERTGAVDVKVIMESSLRMAWNEIRHRARLVKNYGAVPGVDANEARLGQVFLNLVVNAAQALQEGRAEHNEIRVSTRLEGERVVVEVSDTGPGIPPEIIGRIFDAFFTTKAVGVGTGLGLAISQRIVTDMGGELTVESEVEKGTTFRVALPVARNGESEPAAHVAVVPLTRRRGRILVVDDETLVLRGVKRILSKEHDVVAVVAAEKALALCASGEKFDLILCDLMMPDMTGMDLHRELLRVAPEQADRMIFLTGGAFTAKARQFLSETPKEHLDKPFDPANLRAIVQRFLR